MKIIDARPVKPMKPIVTINSLSSGELFYREKFPESIWMKMYYTTNTSVANIVNLKDGQSVEAPDGEIVKRVKGHLVVEEVEE